MSGVEGFLGTGNLIHSSHPLPNSSKIIYASFFG
jgi:hypothetical protein